MNEALILVLLGAAVMACLVIGAFFWRFWKDTRDTLFLAFAVAFWLFGANWAMVAVVGHERFPQVYLFRLVGFLIIIAGVAMKNRSKAPRQRHRRQRRSTAPLAGS